MDFSLNPRAKLPHRGRLSLLVFSGWRRRSGTAESIADWGDWPWAVVLDMNNQADRSFSSCAVPFVTDDPSFSFCWRLDLRSTQLCPYIAKVISATGCRTEP